MKKKSISELIHFFVRHPLQNSLQMKFWRWLVSPADAEDKEEAIQEEWMNIIAEPDEATRRNQTTSSHCFYDINPLIFSAIIVVLYK